MIFGDLWIFRINMSILNKKVIYILFKSVIAHSNKQ